MRSLSKGCTRRTEVRKIPAGCGVAGENPVLLVLNGIIQTQYTRQHSFDLGFRDFTLGTNVRYSTETIQPFKSLEIPKLIRPEQLMRNECDHLDELRDDLHPPPD